MDRNGTKLTSDDRKALMAILPWLESNPNPILEWHTEQAFAHPEYDERVHQVASALGSPFWTHYDYTTVLNDLSPDTPHSAFALAPDVISEMSLEEFCAVVTAFHRGERFSDGFMGSVIESGGALAMVKRALQVCDSLLR